MSNDERSLPDRPSRKGGTPGLKSLAVGITGLLLSAWFGYTSCRIDVGTVQMAILIHKTGIDLPNDQEVAPTADHKGIQMQVLPSGRHFYNPYEWDWQVVDQLIVPEGKVAVLTALVGDDLGYGEFLGEMAQLDGKQYVPKKKGIIPGVLVPGRYPVNPHLFKVEMVDPVLIDPGYQGVVTNLAGPLAKDPNKLLVKTDERGVQPQALAEGRHLINPYEKRISPVDCRSQRFNLAESKAFGFPSKDGFWVSIDGRIQFRLRPEKVPELYVIYNESLNGDEMSDEIIHKVILPNARSFCRLEGSSKLGKDFIDGTTRMEFERRFANAMKMACEPLGIEVQEALITSTRPPEKIAKPIQQREESRLEEKKYQEQIKQQESERDVAEERALALQKAALVEVDQELTRIVTSAMQEQEVAVTKAQERMAVAKVRLEATKDEAEAIVSRGKAEAAVVAFENEADAAGWKQAVKAYDGNGAAYAQYVLYQKLASAYRRIMINTQDSPLMKVFDGATQPHDGPRPPSVPSLAKDVSEPTASK